MALITLHRIWAVTLRHLNHVRHDPDFIGNMLFWPFLEIVSWSFTGKWIQQNQCATPNMGLAMIVAAVFWQIVLRTHYDTALALIEEMRSHNFINLFATPLKICEWMLAVMLYALILLLPISLYCFALVWFIAGYSIFNLGMFLVPLLFLCTLSG